MRRSRGFTLIEAVLCVVILAVAVPPALEIMQASTSARIDAVNAGRATVLATLVLESVLADAASDADGLGYGALADMESYLDADGVGLHDRLAPLTEPFTAAGMSYRVEAGQPVAADGAPASDEALNLFRVLTVTVTFFQADGQARDLPVSVMMGDL